MVKNAHGYNGISPDMPTYRTPKYIYIVPCLMSLGRGHSGHTFALSIDTTVAYRPEIGRDSNFSF